MFNYSNILSFHTTLAGLEANVLIMAAFKKSNLQLILFNMAYDANFDYNSYYMPFINITVKTRG